MDEMIKRLMEKLSAAEQRREAAVTARKAVLDTVEAEKRADLTDEEDQAFQARTAEIAEADEEIRALTERVEGLRAEEERANKAREAAARVGAYQPQAHVTSEELTYSERNGKSYIRDLVNFQLMSDSEARERLARHANEVRTAPEFQEFRTSSLDRTDGNGGFFVPPAWVMASWIELARPGRPTADLLNSMALPPGTDSINIPKVQTGTTTAVQTADGAAVNETSFADTSISIPVRTVAGQQTMAQQLLDQSPLNFDEVIFRDLLADYAVKVDQQVLYGTGSNGQVTGFLSQTGIVSVAAAGQTAANHYSAVANAVQQVHTTRYQPARVIVMHPRRWSLLLSLVDGQGRPLVVPRAYSAINQTGNGILAPQGPVGDYMGLPVVLDANIPTNLGAGTNEDRILVLRPEDDLLYESSIRTRVLPEIKSGNLQVVVQAWGYVAFSAARYPGSTAVITGLTTPAF